MSKQELIEAQKQFGMVRPIHKRNLAQARLNEALDKSHPEPMSLMHKRGKELDKLHRRNDGKPELPYFKPQHSLGVIEKVARAVADWDLNDPFAYGRTALHAKQGYIDPMKLGEEMHMRTVARRVARAREVERERTTENVSES